MPLGVVRAAAEVEEEIEEDLAEVGFLGLSTWPVAACKASGSGCDNESDGGPRALGTQVAT